MTGLECLRNDLDLKPMGSDLRPPKKTRPPNLTPAGFRRAALHHLQRYPCSEEGLRQVLRRRVTRAVSRGQTEQSMADFAPIIDALIISLVQIELLNDEAYAHGLAGSLHRRGKSSRGIRTTLRNKGLPPDLIDAALERIQASHPNADLLAAIRYAKRRRLGPFRADLATRQPKRQRDLASLGRQGFRYQIASTVIDGEADELCDKL